MGPHFLDLLLIGVGVYLVYRFVSRRARPEDRPRQTDWTRPDQGQGTEDVSDARKARARAGWDHVRSGPARGPAAASTGGAPGEGAASAPGERAFDEADFLKGAKAVYVRLQEAWDNRDMEDVREFSTPDFFETVRRQAAESPRGGKTDILLLDASLQDLRTEGGLTWASVLYDAMLREDGSREEPSRVREIWRFVREAGDPKSMWRLSGIDQQEPEAL